MRGQLAQFLTYLLHYISGILGHKNKHWLAKIIIFQFIKSMINLRPIGTGDQIHNEVFEILQKMSTFTNSNRNHSGTISNAWNNIRKLMVY